MFSDNRQPPEPLLEARGVTVWYGGAVALRDADITIRAGERIALVGESGSGKTTLAMALAGMLPASSATVSAATLTFAGCPVTQPTAVLPSGTPGMSIIFQDAMTSLDPTWRIGSQVKAALKANYGLSRRQSTAEAVRWLGRVGFADPDRVMRARPYELSGGMRQRVMLAIALCSRPSLIVADEPTSALDATLARMTMDLLTELSEESGAALLLVTHDLQLCMDYADQVVVMRGGEIVESGPAPTIASNPQHPYTRGLLACVPTLDGVDVEFLPTLASVMDSTETAPETFAEAAS
ncbi:MAG: ABC transporter ATP-binding protein [Gordonia sp. (in: high G+C Gram-positive bacteria)]